MANTLSGNCWYVDTAYASATDDLAANVQIDYVVVTATSASALITLKDPRTGATFITLNVPGNGSTQVFDFTGRPIVCRNGIRIGTLTNAVASIIGRLGG